MARKRTRKPKLPKLLDNATDLVAVVDYEFEVLYANDACCNWLDTKAEQLIGSHLKYSSNSELDPSSSVNSINGICPSPEFFDDAGLSSRSGHIFKTTGQGAKFKTATFTRIVDSSEPNDPFQAVLIVATGNDIDHLLSADSLQNKTIHETLAGILSQERQHFIGSSLVGTSEQAKKLRRQVEAFAGNASDYLIVGNRGSGREHLARTIFYSRNHENAQMLPIHCAIADSQLLQNSIKAWVFEQRDNETNDWLLLLDVDKLQPEAQSELFGYTQLPNFHLRIAATATTDLSNPQVIGDFHHGLAMHLSVQTIRLDDLQGRSEDIPLLAQYFIENNNRNSDHQIAELSNEVLELFFEYSWRQNIDELQTVVDSAHEHCQGNKIQPEDLPDSFHHSVQAERIGYHEVEKIDLDDYLAEIEKELVQRALFHTRNNKTKAAELLGINRAKLIRRTTALGLAEKPATDDDNIIDASVFKEAED